MSSLNKVILIGRLGKDPELKRFASGDAVCNISMATSETWKDKQTGEKKESTEWHNLVFTKKSAEILHQYCKKGALLYVEGKLKTRSWEKEGTKHYTTEVQVNEFKMLGGKGDGGAAANQSAPAPAPAAGSDPDDSIPF